MRSEYSIVCEECDYMKVFEIGIGMLYYPENLLGINSDIELLPMLIKPKKTVNHIKELINSKNAVIADNYGHEIYRCPKCGEFYGRFYIHLDYDIGSYEVEYKCTKCKTKIELIGYEDKKPNFQEKYRIIDLKKYPCPKCKKYTLGNGLIASNDWD